MIEPDDPRHGTNAGHVAGCRDQCCADAKRRYDKLRKLELARTGQRRLVDATGFRRRMRALQTLGWGYPQIAPRLGMGVSTLSSKMIQGSLVSKRNHDAMVRVYNEIGLRLSEGPKANRDRRSAWRKGWHGPLAWDDDTIDDPDAKPYKAPRCKTDNQIDEVVVIRALNGEVVDATIREKYEIVRRWQRKDRSLAELERIQGWRAWRYVEGAA